MLVTAFSQRKKLRWTAACHLQKRKKHQEKPITCFCVFSLAVRSCILYCALRFLFHFFHQLHFPLFGPVYPSFFLRVYLKSRKYGLFLQTQRDFALKSLGIHKGFLRLFALHPACVCEISVIFFVFRYTLAKHFALGAYLALKSFEDII